MKSGASSVLEGHALNESVILGPRASMTLTNYESFILLLSIEEEFYSKEEDCSRKILLPKANVDFFDCTVFVGRGLSSYLGSPS